MDLRAGSLLKKVDWAVVVIVLAFFGYFLLRPQARLPVSMANGVYANSCCGTLELKNGLGVHDGVTFNYVVVPEKTGPNVLPTDRMVSVDDGARLVIVRDEPVLFLALDPSSPPGWIDIPDFGKRYRFVRQR